ncbi:MAG: DNA primase [Elusimicrobiota bacterium]
MDYHKIANEIKDKLDIVDVIREYLPGLRQRGRNYVALCPFHSEKTPSFTVSREKQIFYCFGCNTGGDLIKFVSKYENLTYVETLKKLAVKANISIDMDLLNDSSEEEKEKILIKQINLDAMFMFQKYLKSSEGKKAMKILMDRGFKSETIAHFGIGYAPDSYDLVFKELSKKYPENLILKSQLAISSSGNIMDAFRNRIMIPIKSISGSVIAFGGRSISSDQQPKYINSSETPVFMKRKTLFGIYEAISNIRKTKKAIIVEGYMDVMMMHQYLFNISVSPLGTSFTYDHANSLKNCAEEIIIMFDSDSAGINAALKAADIIIDVGVYPRIALLDEKNDPDEFLLKKGTDEMIKLINTAKDPIEFKIDIVRKKNHKLTPEKKMKILEFMATTLSKQKNEIIKDEWIKKISAELSISESAIKNYLDKNTKETRQQIKISENEDMVIEENFAEILIKRPEFMSIVEMEELSEEDLRSDFARKIYETIKNNFQNSKIIDVLIEKIPQYKNKIMKIMIEEKNEEEIKNATNFHKVVLMIKKNSMEREWNSLKSRVNELTPEELKRFNELSIKLKNLKI